jgi:histidyl-tRNA synthetase
MIARIREVYERYGFAPLETPALEYADVLGKYLPDADRPEGGVFAFRDDEDEWVALRYDLTAPLSRYVAMNPDLPRPFRRYQVGPVYRLEKPGPGRFREFYQFDFDSVGTSSMLADAECCAVMCDTLEALGIRPGDYVVRVNNRKVLNGVLEAMVGGPMPADIAFHVLRSIDKLDRVGLEGVRQLLGAGRRDESGDFLRGVGLPDKQIAVVMEYLQFRADRRAALCDSLEKLVGASEIGRQGVAELREIDEALAGAGYDESRVAFDPTVVRGLAYYTGPVFEAVLTFEVVDETGARRQFGSVFGGGRYDDLVERFTGQKMPATGASIGVDRLLAALTTLGRVNIESTTAPVLVTRLDKTLTRHYQRLANELRSAGVNTELYVGNQGIAKQFKYASDTGKIIAVIMGSEEFAAGQVSIKDLRLGQELAKEVGADRKLWLEQQPAQLTVPHVELIPTVEKILARYQIG